MGRHSSSPPVKSILPSDSLVSLRGTSIKTIKTLRELRTRGIHIELADLLKPRSLGDIANAVEASGKDTAPGQSNAPEPFYLLSDETIKAELLVDRGVVDQFHPTTLQEGFLIARLQSNQGYLYHSVFDVRYLGLVRLQLAFQVAFCLNDTLRSVFVLTTTAFAPTVRQNLPISMRRESISLSKFVEDDNKIGITLHEPVVRVRLLKETIICFPNLSCLFPHSPTSAGQSEPQGPQGASSVADQDGPDTTLL